jgi:hypothetical protein
MTWMAAAIVGSSLITGYTGSKAAKDAARMTSDATVQAAVNSTRDV